MGGGRQVKHTVDGGEKERAKEKDKERPRITLTKNPNPEEATHSKPTQQREQKTAPRTKLIDP